MSNGECTINIKKNVVAAIAVPDSKGVHQCSACEYKTKSTYNLKEHMKSIHDGERYSCNKCNHKAAGKSNLITHVKTVHEGIRYACDQCDHKATRKAYLNSHKLRYHS